MSPSRDEGTAFIFQVRAISLGLQAAVLATSELEIDPLRQTAAESNGRFPGFPVRISESFLRDAARFNRRSFPVVLFRLCPLRIDLDPLFSAC